MYVDAMFPFGFHSAPKIFTAQLMALQWILQLRGVTFVWHYIDDFIVCGPPTSPECHRSLQIMTSTCEELGMPLAKHKVAGPTSCMTVLGIKIDTKAGQLCLPQDKLQQLKALLVSEIVLMEGVGVYCWPPKSCMQGGKTREILLVLHD